MIIAIHQPNYFPWSGYYYKINKVNTFIFLDDVQYTKNSFINRSYIIENYSKSWLTVPVRSLSNNIIKDVNIADKFWKNKHLSKLKNSYQKSNYFNEIWPKLNNIFDKIDKYSIAQINQKIIVETTNLLNIKTDFVCSSDLKINKHLKGDDRLICLLKKMGAKIYLSGKGGKKYQSTEKFLDNGINLIYSTYQPIKYQQKSSVFFEGASILDMFFNIGIKKTIKAIQQN